jgi:hypothetical protein
MKPRFIFIFIILFILGSGLFAQDLSIVLDSNVNYRAGTENAPGHTFGLEQFANLRLRVRGERATFISAFNLIAASGDLAAEQNLNTAMELERLYFRINGEHFDTEAGLMRMAFGYSNVWGSSDFLNPRNPLSHNARPMGALGTTFTFYPGLSTELMVFTAAPKNIFDFNGGGFIPGLSLDHHWSRASIQGLYAFETPLDGLPLGKHRFGLSLKADLELGFVTEVLYTLNPDNINGIDGLSASAGFDYSFLEGDLFILFEYLYNGSESSTALGYGGFFINNHYLSGAATYRFNDFSSIMVSVVFGFDDLSFQPMIGFNYEVFQGFTLNLTANVPIDQKTIRDGKAGEFGPDFSRSRFILNAGARLRF